MESNEHLAGQESLDPNGSSTPSAGLYTVQGDSTQLRPASLQSLRAAADRPGSYGNVSNSSGGPLAQPRSSDFANAPGAKQSLQPAAFFSGFTADQAAPLNIQSIAAGVGSQQQAAHYSTQISAERTSAPSQPGPRPALASLQQRFAQQQQQFLSSQQPAVQSQPAQQLVLVSVDPQQGLVTEQQMLQQFERLNVQGPASDITHVSSDNVYWTHQVPAPANTVPLSSVPTQQYITSQTTYGMGHLIVLSAPSSSAASSEQMMANATDLSQLPVLYTVGPTQVSNSDPYLMSSVNSNMPGLITYVSGGIGAGSSGNLGPATAATSLQPGPGQQVVLLNSAGQGGIPVQATYRAASASAPASGLFTLPALPARFHSLPPALQRRITTLCCNNPIIGVHDFDQKVTSKLASLIETWGVNEAFVVLDQIERRLRSKHGVMKNGPGYLDVAICCHIELLKAQAQGTGLRSNSIVEYSQQVLAPAVFQELVQAITGNVWLEWNHFDEGMIQMIRRFPLSGAIDKLRELTYHSFKNVENIKGCVTSILNSKFREDRRKAADTVLQQDPLKPPGTF